MAHTLRLISTAAITLLAVTACNPAGSPTNNAANAADQNASTSAYDANQGRNEESAARMEDGMEGGMMGGEMKHGMGEMPNNNMSRMKDDRMSNTQSMPNDRPMMNDM